MVSFRKSAAYFCIIIALMLLSSSFPHIPMVMGIGAYTATPPSIDGVIDAAEWQNAATEDIDLGVFDGFHYTGRIYVMNDLTELYIALEINDPNPASSVVGLWFDDDSDFVPDDQVSYQQVSMEYHDRNPAGDVDANEHGEMSSTTGAEVNYFELRKPLASGDPDDFFANLFLLLPLTAGMYYWNTVTGFLEFHDFQIDLDVSVNIVIENIRHPDQVKVGQTTFVTVDVEYELLPPDTPLVIQVFSDGMVGDYLETVHDNGTTTHTFELTAPAAPTTWILTVTAFIEFASFIYDEDIVAIEVKDDLEITPDVEGICIWSGPPPPETAPPSQEIEIPIEVKYAVTYEAWIHAGVYDEDGVLVSTVEFDEKVSGIGTNDYIFEVTTPATEGPWNLKASVYYGHVAGVDSIHDECDEWPFTIIVTSGVPGGEGVKIIDLNSPVEVDGGDEVDVNVQVEYELPAGAKYRANIVDAVSGLVIKTSGEESATSHGFKTFTFDSIYAPFVLTDTTFKLLAVAEYKTDGDWQILDPEGIREFEIIVLGVTVLPGGLPVGPDIPPLPIPPDILPPPPADFDFTLTVTPSTREAIPGEVVEYTATVTGTGGEAQPVALGYSGYPVGSTISMQPFAGLPTYTSNLTVTLGDSVQPETYSLNITATGGGKTHSRTVSLTVKAPSDFSISLSQQEVRVVRGQSTSLNITVEPLHGFNSPVNLNVEGTPSGVTVNFNPNSGTPSFKSRIEVKVDSGVTPGTYPVTITAKGSAEKTAQMILSVDAPRQEAAGRQPQFPYGLLTLIIILILLVALVLAKRRGRPKPTVPPTAPERFCIECGAAVPHDAIHCPKCGAKQP